MPVKSVLRNGKHRIIEAATGRIAKNAAGTALDGGGHGDSSKAKRQARAVNASITKRGPKLE